MSSSKSEGLIKDILLKKSVNFEQEKVLPNLMNSEGIPLPVDFYLEYQHGDTLVKGIIEYQGAQHFADLSGTPDEIMHQIKYGNNDNGRVIYARDNGIPILVIHYQDRERLELIIHRFINEINFWTGKKKRRIAKYGSATVAYFGYSNQKNDGVNISSEYPLGITEVDADNFLTIMKDTILISKNDVSLMLEERKKHQLIIRELNSQLAVAREEIRALSFQSDETQSDETFEEVELEEVKEEKFEFDRKGNVMMTGYLKEKFFLIVNTLKQFLRDRLKEDDIRSVINWVGYYNVTKPMVDDALRRVQYQVSSQQNPDLMSFEYIWGVLKNILVEENIQPNSDLAEKARTVSVIYDEEMGDVEIAGIKVPAIRTTNVSADGNTSGKRFTHDFKQFVYEVSRLGYSLNKVEEAIDKVEKISHSTFLKFAHGDF